MRNDVIKQYMLAFAMLLILVQSGHAEEDKIPGLARRCNQIKWEIDPGSSDTVPRDLRYIQRELKQWGPSILMLLQEAMPHSTNLRCIAANVVAKWPSDQARAILISLVRDPDGKIAGPAAYQCGQLGGRELYAPLLQAVTHPSAQVRHNALNSLSSLGQWALAMGVARERLEDPEEKDFVKHSAISLMERASPKTIVYDSAVASLEAFRNRSANPKLKRVAEQALRVLRAKK